MDPAQQCMVFEHSTGNNNNSKKPAGRSRLPGSIRTFATTFDTPNVFKSAFDKFVPSVQEFAAKQAPRK